ncbi:Carbohydrate-binding protein [Phytophthora megakarya]|uniref:Carbohydrate-binding protein n=1 Tax=Phytophthora megakarya TaxID=4795 RepID=A0A225V1R8_9STRA|nr:Carbohydrate-binding protein [Phytophthora megakarya]
MKFSTILAFMISIEAGMLPSSAQTLVISTDECSSCSVGTFCTGTVPECHGPPDAGTCFNATIGEYQFGCADGYDCFNNKSPTMAPTMAPTNAPSPESSGPFTPCPSGTYWEVDATACRGPTYAGECYNPATARYQNGCAAGFTCINNKCSTIPPATFSPSVCYLQCSANQYCENGTNTCRGPNYAGECFNPASGRYQNGCGLGFECTNNKCVQA